MKEQDKLSQMLGQIIDKVTEPWGVAVDRVQIKDVEIPQSMQRAMAQEAEAHREKRARIIKAEAEYEAAMKLTEAASRMAQTPMAIELRRMQMLTEVGAETEHNDNRDDALRVCERRIGTDKARRPQPGAAK